MDYIAYLACLACLAFGFFAGFAVAFELAVMLLGVPAKNQPAPAPADEEATQPR